MKYLLFLILLLTGCSSTYSIAVHSYDDFESAYKVQNISYDVILTNDKNKTGGQYIYSGDGTVVLSSYYKSIKISGLYFKACLSNTIVCCFFKCDTIILPMKNILVGSRRTLFDQLNDNYNSDRQMFLKQYIIPHLNTIITAPYIISITDTDIYIQRI